MHKPILVALVYTCLPTYTHAFFASLVSTFVLANFPTTPVSKGHLLLHSPEIWSSGACLALGIPMFKIRNVSSVINIGNERAVYLQTNKQNFVLVARGKDLIYIKGYQSNELEEDKEGKGILIKLQHNDTETGFSIFMQLLGYDDRNLPKIWKTCMKKWIELVLFSLYDDKYPPLTRDSRLDLWRKGLVTKEI